MGRERKEFKRPSFVREKQKLFIIATEGHETEVRYFEEFKSDNYYNNSKIFLEVLKRLSHSSSPSHVIKQLVAFKKEYRLDDSDELFMVIDRDKQSWKPAEIAEVARLCLQKKFGLALSNPCFEFWLLLHRKDVFEYTQVERNDILANLKTGQRTRIELELISICGRYSKSKLAVDDYLPHIQNAVLRAKALVLDDNERWPSGLGSHVYKLVEKLLP